MREGKLNERLDFFKGAIFHQFNNLVQKSLKGRPSWLTKTFTEDDMNGELKATIRRVLDFYVENRAFGQMSLRDFGYNVDGCVTLSDFRSLVYSVCVQLDKKVLKSKSASRYPGFCETLLNTKTVAQLAFLLAKFAWFTMPSKLPLKGAQSSNNTSEESVDVVDLCVRCNQGGELLWCDTCPDSFHLSCLDPPLENFPPDDWFCSRCSVAKPVVYAKMQGYPWWPATVEFYDVSKNTIRLRFFGTYAVVDTFIGSHIVPFEKPPKEKDSVKHETLGLAMTEARKYVNYLAALGATQKWNPE